MNVISLQAVHQDIAFIKPGRGRRPHNPDRMLLGTFFLGGLRTSKGTMTGQMKAYGVGVFTANDEGEYVISGLQLFASTSEAEDVFAARIKAENPLLPVELEDQVAIAA